MYTSTFLTSLGSRWIPGGFLVPISPNPSPPFPPPDSIMMNPILTRTLLLLLSSSSLVTAVNFTQCLEDFKQNPSAVGGVDSRGQPVSPAEAVGLTYQTCTAKCGTDWETFIWKDFSQLFSSWLLPWLALLSQLPFGSLHYADDFISG